MDGPIMKPTLLDQSKMKKSDLIHEHGGIINENALQSDEPASCLYFLD